MIHFIFSSERCYFQLKSANSKNILTFDFTMWNSHGLSSSRGKILKSFISPRSGSRRDKVAGKFRFQKIFDQIKLFVEFWDKAAVFSTGIGLDLDLKFDETARFRIDCIASGRVERE